VSACTQVPSILQGSVVGPNDSDARCNQRRFTARFIALQTFICMALGKRRKAQCTSLIPEN
jgi:hypothetical protein